MKKNIIKILIVIVFTFVGGFLINSDVYAVDGISGGCDNGGFFHVADVTTLTASGRTFSGLTARKRSSIESKLHDAGCTRGQLESVQWAAIGNSLNSGTPYCALWAGSVDDPDSGVIRFKDGNTAEFYLYGMCTGNSSIKANSVVFTETDINNVGNWVSSTAKQRQQFALPYINGGAVANNVARSAWTNGQLTGTKMTLDIGMFIKNSDCGDSDADGYILCSKRVNLWRCNANRPDSCSYQELDLKIKTKPPREETLYYAQSNASIGENNDESSLNWDTTGKLLATSEGSEKKVIVGDGDGGRYKIRIGEEAKIVFSHQIFSNKEVAGSVNWSVSGERLDNLWNNGSYDLLGGNSDFRQGFLVAGNAKINVDLGNGYWTTDGNFVKRDEFRVKFKKEGFWKYCEELSFSSNDGKSATTTSCVIVEVVPGVVDGVFAQSNVAIKEDDESGGGKWDSTDLVSQTGYAYVSDDVEKDDVRYIVFSHNAYSEKPGSKKWVLERFNFNGKNSDYEIVDSGKAECGISNGIINFSLANGKIGKFYVGGERVCSGETYFARDWYKVKFKKKGYYKFCEKLIVGDGTPTTESCAGLNVGGSPDPHDHDCHGNDCDVTCNGESSIEYNSDVSSEINRAKENFEYKKTSVVSMVRNQTLENKWSKEIFAKPDDAVEWIHCYYPGVQKMAEDKATLSEGDHDSTLGSGGTTANNNVSLSNSSFGIWDNFFKVTSNQSGVVRSSDYAFRDPTPNSISYNIGQFDFVGSLGDNYRIPFGNKYELKAGKILMETNTSGAPTSVSTSDEGTHSWDCDYRTEYYPCDCVSDGNGGTTCGQCERSRSFSQCHHSNSYITQSRNNTKSVSSASVKVPYNFVNGVSVELESGKPVYAGETVAIDSVDLSVNPKVNNVTMGMYATQVDDAKIKVLTFITNSDVSGGSDVGEVGSGKNANLCGNVRSRYNYEECYDKDGNGADSIDGQVLNERGLLGGSTESYFEGADVNVFDAKAGKYFCVVAAVYPYSSGNDDNMNKRGSNSWYMSAPSCRQVAKKPTFQILGSSLYSAGKVETLAPEKRSLSGVNNVDGKSYEYGGTGGNTAAFNSWVEQGVVALGKVKGLASGAATGKNIGSSYRAFNGKYGSFESGIGDYCKNRAPLSFANSQCSSQAGATGSIFGNSVGASVGVSNTDTPGVVAEYWLNKVGSALEEISNSGDIDISIESNYIAAGSSADLGAGAVLRYTYTSRNLSLAGATIPNQVTHIVKSDKDVTIKGDIGYDKSLDMVSLDYIPKLIIYAKGNININCGVNTIDAILIADGTVDTCSDSSDENDLKRSNQLTINGVVVAKEIRFNRTYGAGTGVNSGVPAEIINYDTSSILWGRYAAGSSQSNTLTMTYQHELAPRL